MSKVPRRNSHGSNIIQYPDFIDIPVCFNPNTIDLRIEKKLKENRSIRSKKSKNVETKTPSKILKHQSPGLKKGSKSPSLDFQSSDDEATTADDKPAHIKILGFRIAVSNKDVGLRVQRFMKTLHSTISDEDTIPYLISHLEIPQISPNQYHPLVYYVSGLLSFTISRTIAQLKQKSAVELILDGIRPFNMIQRVSEKKTKFLERFELLTRFNAFPFLSALYDMVDGNEFHFLVVVCMNMNYSLYKGFSTDQFNYNKHHTYSAVNTSVQSDSAPIKNSVSAILPEDTLSEISPKIRNGDTESQAITNGHVSALSPNYSNDQGNVLIEGQPLNTHLSTPIKSNVNANLINANSITQQPEVSTSFTPPASRSSNESSNSNTTQQSFFNRELDDSPFTSLRNDSISRIASPSLQNSLLGSAGHRRTQSPQPSLVDANSSSNFWSNSPLLKQNQHSSQNPAPTKFLNSNIWGNSNPSRLWEQPSNKNDLMKPLENNLDLKFLHSEEDNTILHSGDLSFSSQTETIDSSNKPIHSNSENAPDSVKGTACGIDSDEEFYDAKSSPENKMKKENNEAPTIPQVDFHDSSSSSFGRNDIDIEGSSVRQSTESSKDKTHAAPGSPNQISEGKEGDSRKPPILQVKSNSGTKNRATDSKENNTGMSTSKECYENPIKLQKNIVTRSTHRLRESSVPPNNFPLKGEEVLELDSSPKVLRSKEILVDGLIFPQYTLESDKYKEIKSSITENFQSIFSEQVQPPSHLIELCDGSSEVQNVASAKKTTSLKQEREKEKERQREREKERLKVKQEQNKKDKLKGIIIPKDHVTVDLPTKAEPRLPPPVSEEVIEAQRKKVEEQRQIIEEEKRKKKEIEKNAVQKPQSEQKIKSDELQNRAKEESVKDKTKDTQGFSKNSSTYSGISNESFSLYDGIEKPKPISKPSPTKEFKDLMSSLNSDIENVSKGKPIKEDCSKESFLFESMSKQLKADLSQARKELKDNDWLLDPEINTVQSVLNEGFSNYTNHRLKKGENFDVSSQKIEFQKKLDELYSENKVMFEESNGFAYSEKKSNVRTPNSSDSKQMYTEEPKTSKQSPNGKADLVDREQESKSKSKDNIKNEMHLTKEDNTPPSDINKAASNKVASDKAASNKAASNKISSNKVASNKAASNKAASNETASNKALPNKAASNQAINSDSKLAKSTERKNTNESKVDQKASESTKPKEKTKLKEDVRFEDETNEDEPRVPEFSEEELLSIKLESESEEDADFLSIVSILQDIFPEVALSEIKLRVRTTEDIDSLIAELFYEKDEILDIEDVEIDFDIDWEEQRELQERKFGMKRVEDKRYSEAVLGIKEMFPDFDLAILNQVYNEHNEDSTMTIESILNGKVSNDFKIIEKSKSIFKSKQEEETQEYHEQFQRNLTRLSLVTGVKSNKISSYLSKHSNDFVKALIDIIYNYQESPRVNGRVQRGGRMNKNTRSISSKKGYEYNENSSEVQELKAIYQSNEEFSKMSDLFFKKGIVFFKGDYIKVIEVATIIIENDGYQLTHGEPPTPSSAEVIAKSPKQKKKVILPSLVGTSYTNQDELRAKYKNMNQLLFSRLSNNSSGVTSYYKDVSREMKTKYRQLLIEEDESVKRDRIESWRMGSDLDLHRLSVRSAMDAVVECLKDWWTQEMNDRESDGKFEKFGPIAEFVEPLVIITGRGNHSSKGVSKIKISVLAYLKKGNYIYDENVGNVSVLGRR